MSLNLSNNQSDVNQPPYTDRGVSGSHNSIQTCVFSLDWLRITIWAAKNDIAPFLAILGADIGLEHTGHGGTGFRSLWQGLNGFQLYSDPVQEDKIYVSVNLPSKALQSIGTDKVIAACSWLCESGFRWSTSRCDLAFDTQIFPVQQFVDAYFEGLVITASKTWEEKKNCDGGHTFYVGSRESLAMLRVYHKQDGCSFGTDAFTRVEMELKGVRADMAFSSLLAADMSHWSRLACGLLNGFLDIPLSWWNDFLVTAESAWLKLRRKVATVASVGKWLRQQVAPSLALYAHAVSQGETAVLVDEINDLLREGQRRFTKRHNQLIAGNDGDGLPQFAVYSF